MLPTVKSLRFRLALGYALFFSVLLVALGLIFRANLASILDAQIRETLEEEWGAAKGYLRVEKSKPVWYSDPNDPEEAFVVEHLRHVYLLADEHGIPLQVSETYQKLGVDPPGEIRSALKSGQPVFHERADGGGVAYLIRGGVLRDGGRQYYLAIGRSLANPDETVSRFTVNYFALLPVLILIASYLGWLLAGRALEPVNSVALAAQRVGSDNLSLRIPSRGAGDELDNLIDRFNEMVGRLQKSFEQTRQFATDVSHELRTPLTAIRGQLEVALLTAETADEFRESLENAMRDVERLTSIVKALLLLSQAESGHLALQMRNINLSEITEFLVSEFEVPAEVGKVSLTARVHPGCVLQADRIQMERLLSNLISNALKYTPQGGSVHVSLEPDGDQVRLSVRDTGIGIPDEKLPHIFDRYYRVRERSDSSSQGLGLGLSFVAWIVKAHGGKLEVDSTVGRGSTFTVMLPRRQEAAAPVATPVKELHS
ncbi:MAG: HAMP domain-containing protein [Bryobacteraceae bacterium]|nr:HAMP domain-containing protein [Bryobacteraceae bacterium]